MGSTASIALTVVIEGGDGSNGRVLKKNCSLEPNVFRNFDSSLDVNRPLSYVS